MKPRTYGPGFFFMKKLGLLPLFLLLLGCSEGFQTQGISDGLSDKLNNFELTAFIQSGPFSGTQVLHNIQNSKLNVAVPAGINSFLVAGGFSGANGQVVGNVTSDATGYKLVHFSVPTSWISQSVNMPMASTLPNGDSLSMFPNNQAAHTMIPLNAQGTVSLHLYFNPPLFGAFVQTPFQYMSSPAYGVTYGSTFVDIGQFSTHAQRPPQDGGLLLFISLPE